MGCKYVKEFDFGAATKAKGKPFAEGGCATKNYARGGKVSPEAREAVHQHERNMHPGKPLTPMKKGGKVVEKGTKEVYASKAAMMRHEKKETKAEEMREHAMKRGGKPVRGPAMAAGRDPRAPLLPPTASSVAPPAYAKGGKFDAKMGKVMGEFGKGKLHSGSKKGPEVTNPKQAIAIAYSEARKATKRK